MLVTGFGWVFLWLSIFGEWWADFNSLATINEHKRMAKVAYANQQYKVAAYHYHYLVDSLKLEDPKLLLNCGHAWFKAGSKRQAWAYYSRLVDTRNKSIQSVAWQQLGFLVGNEPARALAYFRNALHANPANDVARYNYELLKLLHPKADPPKRPQPPNPNQDPSNRKDPNKQQNKAGKDPNKGQNQGDANQKPNQGDGNGQGNEGQKDGNNPSQKRQQDQAKKKSAEQEKGKEGEKGKSAPPDQRSPDLMQANKEELDKLKMSAEQAKALLDAMKNSEVQYLQQRKYPKTNKNRDPEKPIW